MYEFCDISEISEISDEKISWTSDWDKDEDDCLRKFLAMNDSRSRCLIDDCWSDLSDRSRNDDSRDFDFSRDRDEYWDLDDALRDSDRDDACHE
jgi:hypothetical protein